MFWKKQTAFPLLSKADRPIFGQEVQTKSSWPKMFSLFLTFDYLLFVQGILQNDALKKWTALPPCPEDRFDTFCPRTLDLSAPSPGDDLRSKSAIRLRGQIVRSDSFWGIGCDFSAVTIRLRLRCILRWKMAKFASHCGNSLRFRPAIQKIASDCGCDAVVHLALDPKTRD